MAAKSERTIVEALGSPDHNDSYSIDFTGTSSSTDLKANATYRFASTEDCFITITTDGVSSADADDMLLFSGVPEIFQTTKDRFQVNVISNGTNGTLSITRMRTPGR